MQVTQTTADGLKYGFKIVVPADAIAAKVDARIQELSAKVSLPGFRPGKVPLAMVRKRYAGSVMGEVLEDAVQDGVRSTLEERKLTPAMQPKIEVVSFDEGKDLEFTVEFEALPEIGDVDYAGIELTKPVVKVADTEIDEALTRIAESRKTPVATDSKRKAKKGDVLEIDFVGSVDGVEFPGGKGEGYDLELGSGSFIPGFEDQLIGAKADDQVTVNVSFPEDYHAKDLAGKAAQFAVTVKALKEMQIPEINEEFAKSVGLEDVDALKAAVREQIEGDYTRIARGRMKRDLLDKLAEIVSFPVPESMVDAEFGGIWTQIEQAIKTDRLDEEDKGKSEDELKTEYRAIAERRVRLGLLLADAGRKNNIQVTQEDLNRAVMQEAMRYPGQERAVFEFFQKNRDAVEQLRAPIYEDKVVDFILELAKTTEQEVSAEELVKADAEGEDDKPKKKAAAKKKAPAKKKDAETAEATEEA